MVAQHAGAHYCQCFGLKFLNLWAHYLMNKFLVVCSSHSNTIWHSISCNNTVFIIDKNHYLLHFRLWVTNFFFFGCSTVHDLQTLLWDFNSGLKSCIHVKLIAIIRFKKFSPLLNHFHCSCVISRRVCFCTSVSACDTYNAATFFLNK